MLKHKIRARNYLFYVLLVIMVPWIYSCAQQSDTVKSAINYNVDRTNIDSVFSAAKKELSSHNYGNAITELETIVKSDSIKHHAKAYMMIGKSYKFLKKPESVESSFREGLAYVFSDSVLLEDLIDNYLNIDSLDRHEKLYEKILEALPVRIAALETIAQYYLRNGNDEMAIPILNYITKLDTSNVFALRKLLENERRQADIKDPPVEIVKKNQIQSKLKKINHFANGEKYMREEKWNKAKKSFVQALKSDSGNSLILAKLSIVLNKLKEWDKSAFYANKAIDADQSNGLAFIAYGDLCVSLIDYCSTPQKNINYYDKLIYQRAYTNYLNATNSEKYRIEANRKIDLIRLFLPTREEMKINQDMTISNHQCYGFLLNKN